MKDGRELAKELFENMRYTNNHDMPIEDIVRCIAFWGFNNDLPKTIYDTIPFVCKEAKDRIHQIIEKALVWDDYSEFDDFVKCVNKHRIGKENKNE